MEHTSKHLHKIGCGEGAGSPTPLSPFFGTTAYFTKFMRCNNIGQRGRHINLSFKKHTYSLAPSRQGNFANHCSRHGCLLSLNRTLILERCTDNSVFNWVHWYCTRAHQSRFSYPIGRVETDSAPWIRHWLWLIGPVHATGIALDLPAVTPPKSMVSVYQPTLPTVSQSSSAFVSVAEVRSERAAILFALLNSNMDDDSSEDEELLADLQNYREFACICWPGLTSFFKFIHHYTDKEVYD